ncbi:MAG: PBP1A family penicillin-binding protein [Brachymonas sp.]|nr:PBP1A family penicillin-binding protein [Brachymonas sp.]
MSHSPEDSPPSHTAPKSRLGLRILLWMITIPVATALVALMLTLMGLAIAYTRLPDISSLQHYQPKLPLRIFTAEGDLISEFGEERRIYVPFDEIPKTVKDAVLAIEDARFYAHRGVDYTGVLRAGIANFSKAKSQGASTITMQVARNVYLSSEKTIKRKIYEMLLAFKMEHALSKDQILDIYMNQIFLGNRAYGFAAAAEAYFGKSIKDVNLAEAAMLAGLPKAPSLYNPIVNPERARIRQLYILDRMVENGFVTREQAEAAKATPLVIKRMTAEDTVQAGHVGEMVRQLIYAQYGAESYTRGLNVYTTISTRDQNAATHAVRQGVLNYDAKRAYRGPEYFVELPQDAELLDDTIQETLSNIPDAGEMLAAVVIEAKPGKVVVRRTDSEPITISGNGLRFASWSLSNRAPAAQRIRRGAVVRIVQAKNGWEIRQLPEAESALVAMDPHTGAIKALVGGFDFAKNNFNRVTQAQRQPGSSFKPFIYSAALEDGVMPSTMISDSPFTLDASVTGGRAWSPKNYDGSNGPPVSMRQALIRSKNLVSVRILQTVGTKKAQDWAGRFGFPAERTPPYLTMALGAGTVTPLELATGFSVFANGGYKVNPYIIALIKDQRGNTIAEVSPPVLDESMRAIPQRNAFIMNTMMNDVAIRGTAARAAAELGRSDLYGKTGTTNDAKDAWFAGFQSNVVAVVWFGFDTPRNLGDRETGGGLSLPIWIRYMRTALADVPVASLTAKPPAGVQQSGGDWAYSEFAGGRAVASIGVDSSLTASDGTDTTLQGDGFNQGSDEAGGSLGGSSSGGVTDIFHDN